MEHCRHETNSTPSSRPLIVKSMSRVSSCAYLREPSSQRHSIPVAFYPADVETMAGWIKNSTEALPLQERVIHIHCSTEDGIEVKTVCLASFSENRPPPPGFIDLPNLRQPADNLYALQPPYNPSYKFVEDTIVPQINDATHHGNQAQNENVPKEDDTQREKGSCMPNVCIILLVIVIALAAIGWVIYLIARNPKIARTLHKIAMEARRTHIDDEEEGPLFKRMFSPFITHDFDQLFNVTSGDIIESQSQQSVP